MILVRTVGPGNRALGPLSNGREDRSQNVEASKLGGPTDCATMAVSGERYIQAIMALDTSSSACMRYPASSWTTTSARHSPLLSDRGVVALAPHHNYNCAVPILFSPFPQDCCF